MSDSDDRIERQIEIDASAEQVWKLISEPGWWINDGELRTHRIERQGDLDIVHDDVHGRFAIRTVRLDEPRYAAFECLDDPGAAGSADAPSTLTEFWIAERPGGVILRVAESGFAALPISAQKRRRQLDDNAEGWVTELAVARESLTRR